MKPLYTQEQFDKAKSQDKLPCECYECKQIFYTKKNLILLTLKNYKNKNGRDYTNSCNFCNQKCVKNSQKTSKKINCSQCNNEFLKTISQIKKSKSGNHFCSRSCAATYNNKNKTSGNRRSKLEIWIESKLKELYKNENILYNDKTTINSELDIYFPKLNIAFELNGIFHYEPIYGKEKLDKIQNNDNIKFQACLKKEIELCIIDTSQMSYFKESSAKKYLDIITKIINQKNKIVKEL